MTLQAREQHIRREKLPVIFARIKPLCYDSSSLSSAMGKKGLSQLASLSMSKAHYLADKLCEIDGYKMVYSGEFFNEFVTTVNTDVDKILKALEERGILGGYPLEQDGSPEKHKGQVLWCATEMNTKEEIDAMIEILKELV